MCGGRTESAVGAWEERQLTAEDRGLSNRLAAGHEALSNHFDAHAFVSDLHVLVVTNIGESIEQGVFRQLDIVKPDACLRDEGCER